MIRRIILPTLVMGVVVSAVARASGAASLKQSTTPNAGASDATKPLEGPSLTPRAQDELRARIQMATKDYVGAAKAYAKLSQEDPRNAAYLNFEGIALMQLNRFEEARKIFERATKVNKKFAEGLNNIGAIYYAQGKYRKAVREYQKALSIEPQTAGFYSNLGYAYFGEHRYPDAFKAFHHALTLDPKTFQTDDRNGSLMQYRSVADHGLFDFMLAKSYAEMGDAVNCASYLRRALDDGYKKVASARTDPDFAKVVEDQNVKSVLDQAEPLQKTPAAPPGV